MLGAATVVTLATPFAFWAGGDNAIWIRDRDRMMRWRRPSRRAHRIRQGVLAHRRHRGLLRGILVSSIRCCPPISTATCGTAVQAAGINPYATFRPIPRLAALRDAAVYPNIIASNMR